MKGKADLGSFKGAVVLTAVSALMLLGASLIPPLSIIFYFLNKAPLILIFLHHGFKIGLLAYGLMAVLVIPFAGLEYNLAYLFEFGLVAMIMAGGLRLRISIGKVILICAIVSTAILFVSMAVNPPLGAENLLEIPGKLTSQMKHDAQHFGEREGLSSIDLSDPGGLFSVMESIISKAFPALLLLGAAMGGLFNFLTARKISRGFKGLKRYDPGALSRWAAPDKYIWLFIAGGLLALIPAQASRIIGLNLAIVMTCVYFLQGLAIASFFFQKWNLSALFRVPLYIIIFFNIFLSVVVAVVGLFDMWVDFRKLKDPTQDGQSAG